MPLVAATSLEVSPLSTAALLLAAIPQLNELGLPHPSAGEILAALGVSRSRAYELRNRLLRLLDDLVQPLGRPSKPPPQPAPPMLATEVLRYVTEHAGCISAGPVKHRYSKGLRIFVLELIDRHRAVPLETVADAIAVPLGTLKDWMRAEAVPPEPDDDDEPAYARARGPQIETVLEEWKGWAGGFAPFCDHLQLHCRIPFGRTLIARILEAHGVRTRRRRQGRSPDERALRGAFETFFPHAQWVGDGTQIPIDVDGVLHVFNVELDVDAYSGALVGADVSPVEDSDAVIRTFRDAIEATDTRPLALLLDNKPSNHTDDVHDELDDTLCIRATPFRAQNKAHCEGAFGLLKPTLEGLALQGHSQPELAASYLQSLITAVGRAINHRPRADRGGRTRVDLLDDTPTPEEVEHAREALAQRLRKQEEARRTRAARQDPVVRQTLEDAYERLGLLDPQGHILTATARYPLDAIVEGIAIFEGRRRAATLPDTADARYLLGIVHNISLERETWEIALALWDARIAAGDLIADRLQRQRDDIAKPGDEPPDLVKAYVDRATDTTARIDRFFWLTAAADVVIGADEPHHETLFRLAARRISATHALHHRDRTAAIRFLAARIRPLR